MYIQHRYLEENKAFVGTTGLMTIDLPQKGLLSGLELRLKGYTGAMDGTPDCFMHDYITKIEVIVNGSQVVKSLTGDQLVGLMHYWGINHSQWEILNLPNDWIREQWYIPFGRWYHDLEYMLDLGSVNDPELRLHYDFTKTSHHGWTNGLALATGTHAPNICVIPHIVRDTDIVPAGYIKTSEIYRFISGNSKKENMTVPRGPVYANLYPQAYYQGRGLEHASDYIELNLNSDDKIPMRLEAIHMMECVLRQYGEYLGHLSIDAVDGQAFPLPVENGWAIGKIQGADARCVHHSYVGDNGYMVTIVTMATGNVFATALETAITYGGCYPFSIGAIPTFDLKDPRTWINSAELGDMWVRMENSATCGDNTTCILLADEAVNKYL